MEKGDKVVYINSKYYDLEYGKEYEFDSKKYDNIECMYYYKICNFDYGYAIPEYFL